ncbi:MAG: hypothetical protein NTZ97_00190 [Candidatus Moranbacteria bacterium]|nr:hypothetical protein [Candidatus Moranbacteria bacterium]
MNGLKQALKATKPAWITVILGLLLLVIMFIVYNSTTTITNDDNATVEKTETLEGITTETPKFILKVSDIRAGSINYAKVQVSPAIDSKRREYIFFAVRYQGEEKGLAEIVPVGTKIYFQYIEDLQHFIVVPQH